MMRFYLFICWFLVLPMVTIAQFHPTIQRPSAKWMELKTEHFRILYPEGTDSIAWATAKILESQVESTTAMFGSNIDNLPVVIDPYSHAGNGYVTVFPYRIEFNTAPVKGYYINPRSGTWLEAMLPHELVHAAHINAIPPYSVPAFLSLFSPDAGRGMHFTTPFGILEGLAVHHESSLEPGYSGRLNYPYFNLQYNGWGVWSSIMPAGATYPGDRHYIGGAQFSKYLIDTYGEEKVKNLVRSQAAWPFFGFGFQMRRTLGDWSWDIEKDYRAEMGGESAYSTHGEQISRPLWLDDNRILTVRTGYRMPPGFYETDMTSGETTFRHEARLTEDAFYSLTNDRETAIFSRYAPHPRYDGQAQLKSHTLDLDTWRRTDLVDGLHRVVVTPDSLIGFDPVDQSKQWVIPNPAFASIQAVIARKGGMQGLWLVYPKHEAMILGQGPDISFPMASVLDANWSADGLRLMLTSDFDQTLQVYEYDYENDRLFRITNEPGGALEGSISPDGSRYAYISMHGDWSELNVIPRNDAAKTEIPREIWTKGYMQHPEPMNLGSDTPTEGWSTAPYKSATDWLRPRLWLPTFNRASGGVIFSSGDVLRRHAYDLYLGYGTGEIFYDAAYTYAGIYPSITLRTSKTILGPNEKWDAPYYGYETSNRIEATFNRYLDGNARLSQAQLKPFFGYRTMNFQGGDLDGFEVDSWFVGISGFYAHRLRQHLRDPQPTSGLFFYSDADADITYNRRFSQPINQLDPIRAARGLMYVYTPISIRLEAEVYTQNRGYYAMDEALTNHFFANQVVDPSVNTAGALGARYAFPLSHPDTKWPLMPFYSERFYGVLFTKTVMAFSGPASDPATVIGGGLRFKTRIGNFGLDIGAGLAWEPASNEVVFITGF